MLNYSVAELRVFSYEEGFEMMKMKNLGMKS